jgi:Protein of unknown function (DUF3800)
MYILYLDESGTHSDARSFVLAGIAVFEREIHWFAQDVDALQARYFPDEAQPVEFHASKLHAPQDRLVEPYSKITKLQRQQLSRDIFNIVRERRGILFGAVIEKAAIGAANRHHVPYELAFEDLTRISHQEK